MSTPLRYVIVALAAVLLLAVGGIIYLTAAGLTTPDVLQNVAVGALTALAGILVRPSRANDTGDGPDVV